MNLISNGLEIDFDWQRKEDEEKKRTKQSFSVSKSNDSFFFLIIQMSTTKTKEETKETIEQCEFITEPPDGGFGWVIAIAAMVKQN